MAIMCLLSYIKSVPVVCEVQLNMLTLKHNTHKQSLIRLGSAHKHLRRILEPAKEVSVHSVLFLVLLLLLLLLLLLPSHWLM